MIKTRVAAGDSGVTRVQQVTGLMERPVITVRRFIAVEPGRKINYTSGMTLGDYLWLLSWLLVERESSPPPGSCPGLQNKGSIWMLNNILLNGRSTKIKEFSSSPLSSPFPIKSENKPFAIRYQSNLKVIYLVFGTVNPRRPDVKWVELDA